MIKIGQLYLPKSTSKSLQSPLIIHSLNLGKYILWCADTIPFIEKNPIDSSSLSVSPCNILALFHYLLAPFLAALSVW